MSRLVSIVSLLYYFQLTLSSNVLTQVGSLYLPDNVGIDGVESIAIDIVNSLIFSANGDLLTVDVTSFVATISNIENVNIPMKLIKNINIESAINNFDGISIDAITSVTYSKINQYIYATVSPTKVAEEFGYLIFINPSTLQISKILKLTDCYLPDHITTTSNGKTIIISCEGEADDNKSPNPLINPPGSITLVNTKTFKITNVNFNEFDAGGSKTLPFDIYLPYKTESFSINAEPEYCVVDNNDKYAYITLQENNAIAVLDIKNKEIINIFSLGFHDYSIPGHGLDASNKDGSINIQNYPNLYGLRMPDSIDYLQTSDGKQYILTANEGDSKKFDESRVGKIKLNQDAFEGIDLNELQKNENLGRLKIINQLGLDSTGQLYNELYTFNSRDFTVWEIITSDSGSGSSDSGSSSSDSKDDINNNNIIGINLIYSSLDEFEQITANEIGINGFNSDYYNPSFDDRSDDKGPEPETIVVGKCNNGKIFSFIGLERVGGIMVYDISVTNNFHFVQYLNNRDFNVLFTEDTRPPKIAGDTAPEQLKFIHENVYGVPLLFAAFTESSSISIYTVDCN